MVRAKNNVQVARKLGVSEMAVRKRLKRIGLIGGKKYRKKSDQPRLF
jgi:Zn-dependent peptidase ImmA (M78 family)